MAGFKDFIKKGQNNIVMLFDMDDTVTRSKAMIGITHADGSKEELTIKEYAGYVKREGDVFDFGQFREIIDPEPIEEVHKLIKAAAKKGYDLGIVTARGKEAQASIEKVLKQFGLPKMKIHCVGTSSAVAKVRVLEDYINSGYDRVIFFDDKLTNVRVANKTLGNKYPGKFQAYQINEEGEVVK